MNSTTWTIPGSAAIWLAIGWSVAGAGLVLLLWALFKDRARGRLRCPKCWYDMSGARAPAAGEAMNLRCPECGHDARTVKRLGKTRRRWRAAFLALIVVVLGCAAISVPTVNRVRSDGWWSIAPEWLLVRVVRDRGWNQAIRLPGAPELELRSRASSGGLSPSAIREILDAPRSVRVRTPKRWVKGEPLVLGVRLNDWARRPPDLTWRVVGSTTSAQLQPRAPAPKIMGNGTSEEKQWEFFIPPEEVKTVSGLVTVEACDSGTSGVTVWSRQFPIAVVLRPSAETLLDEFDWKKFEKAVWFTPKLDPSLANSNLCVGLEGGGRSNDLSDELEDFPRSTVFAFRLEFIINKRVVARGRAACSFDPIERHEQSSGDALEIIDPSWDRRMSDQLLVRLTTDRETNWRDWEATRLWSGDLTLPARELVERLPPHSSFSDLVPPPTSGPGPYE